MQGNIIVLVTEEKKKKQADVNFRLVSAFIFSFTKVMLQLGDKLLACEVLVSY